MSLGNQAAALASRFGKPLLVWAAIIAGQLLLIGPSLAGRKILLPLDLLAATDMYLPRTAEYAAVRPHDLTLSDLVLFFEPTRRFAASEIRQGRMPSWAPYQYAGAPVVWPKYSPLLFLESLTPSPVAVAWGQLLAASVAGIGFYFFCRRALALTPLAAGIVASVYPMTGFFVFWQGYPTCASAYWFPWLLLAVDHTVRHGRSLVPAGLAVATGLTLVGGHGDVAAQALMGAGL